MSDNQINQRSKRKFTKEERKNYYEAWKQSELNTTEFCKMHGISKSALYTWTRQFGKEMNGPDFTPLIIKEDPPLKSIEKVPLAIAFNNGPLQINLEVPEHRLVSIIQELSHAARIIR